MKAMPTLNAAIELHDSIVEAVRFSNGNLEVAVSAYIHRSIGIPGVDDGTGWVQDVVIDFQDGKLTGDLGNLPARIFDGELHIGSQIFPNMISLPCDIVGPILLTLFVSPDNRRLVLFGDSMVVRPKEEAKYVEDFSRLH